MSRAAVGIAAIIFLVGSIYFLQFRQNSLAPILAIEMASPPDASSPTPTVPQATVAATRFVGTCDEKCVRQNFPVPVLAIKTASPTATASLPSSPPAGTCDEPDRTVDPLELPDCAIYGLQKRTTPIRLHYGMMVGFETEVLEIAIHEIYPVVDTILIVETKMSHSRKQKPLTFNKTFHERLLRFRDKITYVPIIGHKRSRFPNNWAVEKYQRNKIHYLMIHKKDVINLRDGDIVVANADVDEIIKRRVLSRWKYCTAKPPFFFDLLQMRYSFRCLQFTFLAGYGATAFVHEGNITMDMNFWRGRFRRILMFNSIHNLTNASNPLLDDTSWHLSSFGSASDVMRKNDHSPHRHVAEKKRTETEVQQEMATCTYRDEQMLRMSLPPRGLPSFVVKNLCYFQKKEWV